MLGLLANSMLKSRVRWEQDLEQTFRDTEWEPIRAGSQNFAYNSCHKLLQLNVTHRIYYTPEKLHRMNSAISENCPRCKKDTGNLIHMFWSYKINTLLGLHFGCTKEGHGGRNLSLTKTCLARGRNSSASWQEEKYTLYKN